MVPCLAGTVTASRITDPTTGASVLCVQPTSVCLAVTFFLQKNKKSKESVNMALFELSAVNVLDLFFKLFPDKTDQKKKVSVLFRTLI